MGTAQSLDSILRQLGELRGLMEYVLTLESHNHALLHALLERHGATKEDIEKLLSAQVDSSKLTSMIGELNAPTEALRAAVKANQ
jgi:dephospho-CoA kinase